MHWYLLGLRFSYGPHGAKQAFVRHARNDYSPNSCRLASADFCAFSSLVSLPSAFAQPGSRADLREKPRRPLTSTLGVTVIRATSMNYTDVIRDFALRTRKNLEAIDVLAANHGKVFEITQLINSLLGLLVFPQQKYVDSIPKTPLTELERTGWPIPRVRGKFEQVQDLNQLIRYLRNAVAHFNIVFIDDTNNNIALLRVWNMVPVRGEDGKVQRGKDGKLIEQKNWEAELGVKELRGIADRFIDLLLEQK